MYFYTVYLKTSSLSLFKKYFYVVKKNLNRKNYTFFKKPGFGISSKNK